MRMNFQHLGLTVAEESDIREFYQDILKMDIQREFTLNRRQARQIFNEDRDIKIVVGTIGDLSVELFMADEKCKTVCEHVCISVADRQAVIDACQANNFPITIIERKPFDIVFIRDKTGNLFEIKEEE
ncbi:MAG TPA: hypothetical protein DHW42_10835 [Candidatus Marinimicrobia bacterium]|nr:hypothetical protein [Candidatus Neomarinimicrobiota bacterium]